MTALFDDYTAFCGSGYDDKDKPIALLSPSKRITPLAYSKLKDDEEHILLDVREPQELQICSLPDVSQNIPYSTMNSEMSMMALEDFFLGKLSSHSDTAKPLSVYVVCRRGNDSQRAVKLLEEKFTGLSLSFKDIEGGLHQWAKDVDTDFPVY